MSHLMSCSPAASLPQKWTCVLKSLCQRRPCKFCHVCPSKERMETANKQLAAKECDDTEDNRKTISQLLAQSEQHTLPTHRPRRAYTVSAERRPRQ